MTPNFYWREFTRNGSIGVDHLADAGFLSTNFVDFFGKWLQEGDNASLESLDALMMVFFSQHIYGCSILLTDLS